MFGIWSPPPHLRKSPNSSRKVPQNVWNLVTPPPSLKKSPHSSRKVPFFLDMGENPPCIKKSPSRNNHKKFLEKFGIGNDPHPLDFFQKNTDFLSGWLPFNTHVTNLKFILGIPLAKRLIGKTGRREEEEGDMEGDEEEQGDEQEEQEDILTL